MLMLLLGRGEAVEVWEGDGLFKLGREGVLLMYWSGLGEGDRWEVVLRSRI